MRGSLNAMGGGGARRGLAAFVAVVVALFAGLGLGAGPAAAHSGGKAIVLVESLTIVPSGDSWQANAVLADFDGGGPLSSVDVQLMGAGLTKLTPMIESDARPGSYQLALPKAEPGNVEMTMQVRTLPGGPPVGNFEMTYPGTLVAGQALSLTSGKVVPAEGGGGGGNTGMIVAVAGAVLLVAVLYGLFSVRRRTAVPARAK